MRSMKELVVNQMDLQEASSSSGTYTDARYKNCH